MTSVSSVTDQEESDTDNMETESTVTGDEVVGEDGGIDPEARSIDTVSSKEWCLMS